MKSAKWIKRIKQGADQQSANRLIAHYFDEIYNYVYQRVNHEPTAMDVTQEVFVSMLQSLDNYQSEKSLFRTWLYNISKR